MSGGPRQLFDPEAPPEAAAPASRAASGGVEPEDRRGVHSIGGVYDQVEGALNQAFPRNRHLWVRGEIEHVSDHRSGHLYMSLVDPEDDGAAAGPRPRRRAHAQREVLAQLLGAAAPWAGQGGHRARRGDGGGPAWLARPLPGQGRAQPDPRRGRRDGVARSPGRPAGAPPADARVRGPAAPQCGPAPAGGGAARRAGCQPGHGRLSRLPRPADGFGVRVPHLARAGPRPGPRCAGVHRPRPDGARPE